jgi:mercuric ion transport protein
VPLILVMLGISGAWIGTLTALEPYRPYFVTGTALVLGAGYRNVYFMPRKNCEAGSYCASPASQLVTKSALWLATLIALLAGTVNFWAPLLY